MGRGAAWKWLLDAMVYGGIEPEQIQLNLDTFLEERNLKTYVNVFYSKATQRAFVKALLGEILFEGKIPVRLDDFNTEV